MPPQFTRLGIVTFIFTLLCFSAWRLTQLQNGLGDSGMGFPPPLYNTGHTNDRNAPIIPPHGFGDIDINDIEFLDAPDGSSSSNGKGSGSGSGDNKVVVTVTETVYKDRPETEETPTPSIEDTTPAATDEAGPINGATPAEKGADPIRKITDFERYAGHVEDYQKLLDENDRTVLQAMEVKSTRQERLKRLYELDGAEDWMKFIQDQDDSAMPPLTKFTQEYLYKWQHPSPEDCANRKFLVLHHNWDGNGIGTVVHGTSWVLGLAIRLNRILIYDDDKSPGENFFEKNCMGDGRRSFDCIFESFSSCSSHRDLRTGNHSKLRSYWKVPEDINMTTSAVPPLFGQALKNNFPEMHHDAIKYWWRTQASSYMMRLNGPSLRRLKQLRLDESLNTAITHDEFGTLVTAPVPFPLPDGSFSMHVRHGDKGVEMELIPFRKYVDAAEEFAAMNMIMARKTCFISTEDKAVIEEAKTIGNAWISPNTTSNENWTWIWSDIPRINGGPVEQLNAFGNRTEMTLKWMSQLIFAIEAPYIVGTRGSGWNRMIDELRCVWVDCRTPYMEVGPFTDWVHYNF